MWVLTEYGELLNFAHVSMVFVGFGGSSVNASLLNDGGNSPVLCACDDEEHGKRIITMLYDQLGDQRASMTQVKERVRQDMLRRQGRITPQNISETIQPEEIRDYDFF